MSDPAPQSQLLIYQSEDGRIKLDVRFEGETVWLTQQLMAELFDTTKQNVSLHLQNIFKEGELQEDSVVKESLTTASDGKSYRKKFYNLDAILSVGYRVKSGVATQFRIWATQRLREYIVKGFVLDDARILHPASCILHLVSCIPPVFTLPATPSAPVPPVSARAHAPRSATPATPARAASA